jgi:hypothetical protein
MQTISIALCHACGTESSKESDPDVLEAFDSVELQAELDRLRDHIDLLSLLAVENGPPSKRIKLREEGHLLDEVVSDLSALLESQRASDLYELSQVAEYVAVDFLQLNS